jgi:DNA invertase Pin-like site-specific DNA recombinase
MLPAKSQEVGFMPNKVNRTVEKKVIKMYLAGIGANTIAREIGYSNGLIYDILRRNDVKSRGRERGQEFKRKVSGKNLELALRLFDNGSTATEIAARLDCTVATAAAALKAAGRELRPGGLHRFDNSDCAKIIALREAGKSQQAIADELGVSQPIIGRTLRRLGVSSDSRMPRREQHGMWKGGKTKAGGYVMVMPQSGDAIGAAMMNSVGYVQEHRLVMAHELGRPLLQHETVHHIDGNKENNKVSNLQLRFGKHGKHIAYECAACGSRNIRPASID